MCVWGGWGRTYVGIFVQARETVTQISTYTAITSRKKAGHPPSPNQSSPKPHSPYAYTAPPTAHTPVPPDAPTAEYSTRHISALLPPLPPRSRKTHDIPPPSYPPLARITRPPTTLQHIRHDRPMRQTHRLRHPRRAARTAQHRQVPPRLKPHLLPRLPLPPHPFPPVRILLFFFQPLQAK